MRIKTLSKIILTLFVSILLQPSVVIAADKLLIAGGLDSGAQVNLFAMSVDSGKTWRIKPLPNVNNSASIGSSDCTGLAGAASCLVSIKNHLTSAQDLSPWLYYTKNNGVAWSPVSLSLPWPKNVAHDITINKVSCTGSANDVICFAAGSYQLLRSAQDLLPSPLLIATSNGGKSWSLKNIPNLPAKGEFTASHCSGSGATAVCVVIGNSAENKPFIAVSTDGGNTLALKNIVEDSDKVHLSALSCTGSAANTVCVIIGEKMARGVEPVIVTTVNAGDTWHLQTPPLVDAKLNAISCTGTASDPVCIIGGSATQSLLLLASNDKGNTWQQKTIAILDNYGAIKDVSCAGKGKTAVCMAMGATGGFSTYFVAASTDGADTWQMQTFDLLRYTESSGVSCDGQDSAVTCMLWGESLNKSYWLAPAIATTTNNGLNWIFHNLPGVTTGIINAGVVTKTISK
jgi:hypothetical protein